MGLIPGPGRPVPSVLLATWAVVLAWSAGVYLVLSERPTAVQRQWMACLVDLGPLLVGFYGLIYGAGYFMGRYLYPLSPWMAVLTVTMVHRLWVVGRPARSSGDGSSGSVLHPRYVDRA